MSAAQGEEALGDTFTVAVAEELRVQMVRKNVTGRELARRLHVSSQWVSQRTRAAVPMDTRDLASVAAALEITIDELLRDAIRRTTGEVINTRQYGPAEDGVVIPFPQVSGMTPTSRYGDTPVTEAERGQSCESWRSA